ncbi:hypothetical protein QZH41_003679 [Actinostola sp. cb2023]|nr:hypothetical protein QZH41_003679 [Actinostola sp. cb2023]
MILVDVFVLDKDMEIFYIILEFYGPQPSAIKIERSRDHGLTFKPWQYFAEDCIKSFTLANNGPLPQPDSINCIQYEFSSIVQCSAAQRSAAQRSAEQRSAAQRSAAQSSAAQQSSAEQRSAAQQHTTAQHSAAQSSTPQHSTAQRSAAQHSTAQHSTAQHSTAQHSTAQHSTAQHSTAQHSTAQHSTAQIALIFSSGIGRTYDDTDLGIYSLQRYQVVVFTSTGNSTSPTVNTVVHRYGALPGNQTNLAVKGLNPSTKYRFWITLDNNAGNATSKPVLERTLDGVPEGFGTPSLFDKSSTEIRVSWNPPTTPNGQIVIYKIYANGNLLANASSSTSQVTLTNLLPYTVYNIRVEVCTVYACTKSPVASKRTQPAAPDDLAPPRLTPGPNFMVINWDPPSRPNGIMGGYKLFRHNIILIQICCNAVLHQRDRADPNKKCCGIAYVTKNNANDVCCGNKFHINQNDFQCCYSNYMRVPSGQACCRRNDGGAVVGYGDSCCGDRPYFINGSKVCVCDGLFERSPPRQCCGGKVVARAQICCATGKVGRAYDIDSTKICCGAQYLAEKTSLCCKGPLDTVKVYNYSSAAEKNNKAEKCCNANKVISEYEYYLLGINTEGNTTSSLARNKTLMASPDGLEPPVATAISASAIRVTWKPPLVSNGILKEYKLTRINKQTNQRKLVYSGLALTFTDDAGLEPFTGYVYELQACTTECTTVLSNIIVYTDEAAPSVVSAPSLNPLSSTSINVTWSLPPKPNGRISRYNISQVINSTYKIRLNPSDKGLTMFLIVDNLKPYNNYTFQVVACTKIGCTEGPAGSVFTLEAAPQGVRPPVLVVTGAREIEASWFEPDVPNGIISQYSLYRNGTLVYNGTDVCSKTAQGQVKCIYKDTGLSPMTSYSYSVAAKTTGGTTRSDSSSAQTPESSPEGVPLPRLTPRSAYEIYAEWDPPLTPNGVIIRYGIIVDGKEYNTTLNKHKVIGGLKPYTKYAFQVKACTSKGCGIGNRAYARTSEAPPSGVNPPRLEAKEWNVVYVSWDEPTAPNGVITEYRVERRLGNQVPIIVCRLTTGSTLPTRDCLDSSNSLKGYTVYEYRIRAKNGGGIGTGSWKSVRTLEGPPRGILKEAVSVRFDHPIRVQN